MVAKVLNLDKKHFRKKKQTPQCCYRQQRRLLFPLQIIILLFTRKVSRKCHFQMLGRKREPLQPST
jgi:hypothetical protein